MGLSFECLIHWLTLMRWAERVRQLFSLMEFENANLRISSVQSLSRVRLFVSPWTEAHQASLSNTSSWSLLKFMSTESLMPSNHPLPSPSPPAFNLSQHHGLSQWVSSLHQVAKVLELQHQVLPMNIQDWFPLGCTTWISLQSKGPSRVFSNTIE